MGLRFRETLENVTRQEGVGKGEKRNAQQCWHRTFKEHGFNDGLALAISLWFPRLLGPTYIDRTRPQRGYPSLARPGRLKLFLANRSSVGTFFHCQFPI